MSSDQDGARVVTAFGGHWAVCPVCLWDSGEAAPRVKAQLAALRHPSPCQATTPAGYSTERRRENQVMLSGHP